MYRATTIFALSATLVGLARCSPIPNPAPQDWAPWQTASWQSAPWQTASWMSAPWQTAPGQTVPGPMGAAPVATPAVESSAPAPAVTTAPAAPQNYAPPDPPAPAPPAPTTTTTPAAAPAYTPPPVAPAPAPASSPAPAPAPAAASSAAPAPPPSSDTSSGSSGTHDGIATVNPNDSNALGSCGGSTGDSTFTVALSTHWMTGYDSALCNKYITVTNTGPSTDQSIGGKGNTVKVQVMDTCEGCDEGHLDLSEAAWNQLTGNAAWSQVGISWEFD